MSLHVPSGLLAVGIHGYSPAGDAKKRAFHRDGRRFLGALATVLGLPKGGFEVRSNKGGIAVSGEVTLHSDTLYVQIYESVFHPGIDVLYRRCHGRADYCGVQNQFVAVTDLIKPERLDRFVRDLKVLGGLMRDLRLAA